MQLGMIGLGRMGASMARRVLRGGHARVVHDCNYAEGLNILHSTNVGQHDRLAQRGHDAETTPLRDPELYRFEMNLPEIAEVWRRGSVIGSFATNSVAMRSSRRHDTRAQSSQIGNAVRTPRHSE